MNFSIAFFVNCELYMKEIFKVVGLIIFTSMHICLYILCLPVIFGVTITTRATATVDNIRRGIGEMQPYTG